MVFYGKLSKIKTREQLRSPVSCFLSFFFVKRTAMEGALPALSLEIGVDDRLQTMKGVGVLHPLEVEVPAQHIIIHPLWFVWGFFSLFLFTLCLLFFFPVFISSLWLCAPFSAFVLLVSRLSVSPLCFCFVICGNLLVFHLLLSHNSLICPTSSSPPPTNIYLFLILPTSPHGTCLILLVPTLWCHS